MLDELTITLIVIAIILLFLFFYSKNKKSNINNHDHLKKCHDDKVSAMKEIKRMQAEQIKGSERLNAYYSNVRNCWLIGKSSLLYKKK